MAEGGSRAGDRHPADSRRLRIRKHPAGEACLAPTDDFAGSQPGSPLRTLALPFHKPSTPHTPWHRPCIPPPPSPGAVLRRCQIGSRERGGWTMSMDSLKDLYVEQLRDLYSAENQILKALPMMAEKASNPELRAAFEEHERVTGDQVKRLETIFDGLGEKPSGHHCKGMEGLLKEGQE